MARREIEREDLMRDARALARRIELRLPDEPEPVVAGFRPRGIVSVYFGADPVFHFDERARLRRAFVGGALYRSQGSTLARLVRRRTECETELRRHDLTPPELREFLARTSQRIERLGRAIAEGRVEVTRRVPADAELLSEVRALLTRISTAKIGLAPPVAGRR